MQSLNIEFNNFISNGLADLISVQKNLKYLGLTHSYDGVESLKDIIPSLTKISNTLIKLNVFVFHHISLSFIAKFINLQELELSFYYSDLFSSSFEKLQHITFSQLKILRIKYACPRYELLIKFLENNGKNLKEFYADGDNLLNLAIAKFCPNLRKLYTRFKHNELETFKTVFNNCQYLESIKIWCDNGYLSKKEALKAIVKYSHKNLHEIILLYPTYNVQSRLLPEELESFLISWKNSISQKSLSLIIIKYEETNSLNSLDTNDENMKIIEKYIKLGVVKKFKVTDFNDVEFR
jgi:hypothetical protein